MSCDLSQFLNMAEALQASASAGRLYIADSKVGEPTIEISYYGLKGRILAFLSNIPWVRELSSIQSFAQQIRSENAQVLGVFLGALSSRFGEKAASSAISKNNIDLSGRTPLSLRTIQCLKEDGCTFFIAQASPRLFTFPVKESKLINQQVIDISCEGAYSLKQHYKDIAAIQLKYCSINNEESVIHSGQATSLFAAHRKSNDKDIMVSVIATEQGTISASRSRDKTESIINYLEDEIERKGIALSNMLAKGLMAISQFDRKPDVIFFTAPEFYWNIPWTAIRSEEELQWVAQYYLATITPHVQRLIEQFPKQKWGNLVIMPGTVAVLVKTDETRNTSPMLNFLGLKPRLRVYEVLNYALCSNNIEPSTEQKTPPLSMWPKQNVSHIDLYGWQQYCNDDCLQVMIANNVEILVRDTSAFTAEHYDATGYGVLFKNQLFNGLSFGIDICLDYLECYNNGENKRVTELEHKHYTLNFLLASGMRADKKNSYPPSVQYIVQNDGDDTEPECRINATHGNRYAHISQSVP